MFLVFRWAYWVIDQAIICEESSCTGHSTIGECHLYEEEKGGDQDCPLVDSAKDRDPVRSTSRSRRLSADAFGEEWCDPLLGFRTDSVKV